MFVAATVQVTLASHATVGAVCTVLPVVESGFAPAGASSPVLFPGRRSMTRPPNSETQAITTHAAARAPCAGRREETAGRRRPSVTHVATTANALVL